MKITKEDACRILGVKEDASPDEVRSSYKRLALKWHPDKHGDSHITKDEATQKFQEVSAAYKRLTTNVNDADDEIDDNEFMNIREMMELFAHIFFHNGSRACPHHGMDCCEYEEDEYFYSDDEYYDYTDEESDDEFLDTIAHRLRNKYEARKYMTKDKIPTQRQSLTEEEALRNARELIEEEELEKKREEKKKAKRKKKKEKKKQKEKEKKEQEIVIEKIKLKEEVKSESLPNTRNEENTNHRKPPITESNGISMIEKQQKEVLPNNKQETREINIKKTDKNNKKNIAKSNNNKDDPANKNTDTKNRNNKNESDVDEEMIDTNSAFFAHAASKAPTLNGTQPTITNETNNQDPLSNKKKSSNNQSEQQQQNKKVNKQKNSSSSTESTNKKQKDNSSTESTNKKNFSNNASTVDKPITNTNIPLVNGTSHAHQPSLPQLSNKNYFDTLILKSRQIAVKGNQMAQAGDYHAAVKLFTEAINLDKTDFRFFGNRSYCYDRIEKYQKALEDADSAINLAPEWPKGHFRKGRALTGLKRFQEAEQVFQQVLKLDPVCEDAQFELARVRVQILVDMGFTQSLSEQAVRAYGTVQQSLEALLAGKVSDEESSEEVYFSEEDEVYEEVPVNQNNNDTSKHKQTSRQPEPKCTAIWVGNVDPQMVTEKQMSQLFSKCGKVSSVRILPHKYCAFVNYVEPASATLAMEKLQGAGLGNQKLLLRFPNNPPPGSYIPDNINTQKNVNKSSSLSESSNDSSKLSGPVNGNECYFWRTTGCVFENQCRYKHVRGHKGVDLSKVQAKYGKIPSS